jgi:hypothetical protein
VKEIGIALLALLLGSTASAQDADLPELRLEQLMSAEEFRNAGLQKLSADELSTLNAWLHKFTLKVSDAIATEPLAKGVTGRWLSLESNTVRTLREDGNYVYGELFKRDEKESIGSYDLVKQRDGTISGRGRGAWSCKFLCRDISCDVPRWIENSCVIEQDVVLTVTAPNRIEGYIVAPKPPEPHDKAFAGFCRKCGANAPKLKQPFVWVRLE